MIGTHEFAFNFVKITESEQLLWSQYSGVIRFVNTKCCALLTSEHKLTANSNSLQFSEIVECGAV